MCTVDASGSESALLFLASMRCTKLVMTDVQKYHRIIENFGLEGTPKGHLVQTPSSEGLDI